MKTKVLLCSIVLLVAGLSTANATILLNQQYVVQAEGASAAGGAYVGSGSLETPSNKCDEFVLSSNATITTVTFYVANPDSTTPPMRALVTFFSNTTVNDENNPYNGQDVPTNDAQNSVVPPGYWWPQSAAAMAAYFPWSSTDNAVNGELYAGCVQTDGKGMTVIDTGTQLYEREVYQVTVELPNGGFAVTAGTKYWVGMTVSDQAGEGDPLDQYWMVSCPNIGPVMRACEANWSGGAYGSPLWGSTDNVFPVVLEGTVPEPATMALLAVGAIGMVIRRRRAA